MQHSIKKSFPEQGLRLWEQRWVALASVGFKAYSRKSPKLALPHAQSTGSGCICATERPDASPEWAREVRQAFVF